MTDDLKDRMHQLLFGVRRSIRYHYRKVRFYDLFHKMAVFLAALTGTATLTSILAQAGQAVTLTMASLVTIFSVLDLVVDAAQKARNHNDYAKRYFDIEKEIICTTDPAPDILTALTVRRLDIEAEEPPPLKVLDAMCHNELIRACGYDTSHLVDIKWYQRLCAHFIDLREHAIKNRV